METQEIIDNCGIVGVDKAVLSLCYSKELKHDRAP